MLLLLFMYIFAFPILGTNFPLGSSHAVGILLMIYYIIKPKYRSITNNVFKKKKVFFIFVFLGVITLFAIAIPTIFLTYDFTILSKFRGVFISLFIGTLLFCVYKERNNVDKISVHIVYVSLIQALIQTISFLNENIRILLDIFRTDRTISSRLYNEGARGLSVSSSSFYGLAISYGLVIIIFFDNWEKIFPNRPILRWFSVILIGFGSISAARISLVGPILGILYIIIKKTINNKIITKRKYNIKKTFNILLLPLILMLVVIMISSINFEITAIDQAFESFQNFAFEPVMNYLETGNLTSESTSILFDEMYFNIDGKTLLIGDGRYTSSTGGYYMSTDAGYMRNILFFGIIGLIMLFIFQSLFFIWNEKENILLNITIIVFILFVHIKGEAIAYSVMMQSIIYLIYLKDLTRYYEKNYEV